MEDIIPKPLRVIKTQSNSKHEIRSVSRSSYPSIPCRSSSLRLDSRQVSSDSSTSTTPSPPPFSDNSEPIKIRKRSRAYTISSQDRDSEGQSVSYPRGSDETDKQTSPETGCRKETKSRFFSGWSFKSWSSTMRRLSFDQTNGRDGSYPIISSKTYSGNGTAEKDSGPLVYPSTDFLINEKADILTPRTIPITGIDMNTATNPPIIGTGPDSIWATVNISAEASSNEPVNLGWPTPLDVVIILDIVPHIHISMLRQIVVSSLAIVSSLSIDDRFAIAYVDKDSADGFGLLLPLGVHSLDSARIAIDVFSLHQLTSQRSRKIGLQKIIQQISETVYLRDRPALCHAFFVTASPSVRLSTPAMDKGIGFHTISPHFRFPFSGFEIPSGWHIFYDINSYDADSKEAMLRHKISTAIEHMRTGVEPGVVTDLKLSLTAGDRCELQAVLEECHLDLLRPGEKWMVPVQIRVPAASIKQPLQVTDGNTICNSSHPTVDKVMTQLQNLLTDFSHEDITQHIVSARLEYRHTLLPAHNIVHLESSCTVVRDVHEFGIASLGP